MDGDTLVLVGGDRVRILGIDTPEMHDGSPLLKTLAQAAKDELARRVTGRGVRLIVTETERDHFGRLLAYVHVESGQVGGGDGGGPSEDVGEQLLAASLARAYPSNHPRLDHYLAVEAEARKAGRGVWAQEARKAWGPRADIAIGPAQAPEHLGQIARVEGRVTSSTRTAKAIFLNLEGGGATLKVVSFHPTFFPPELVESWMNHHVAATGKLKDYQGKPELVVERPDQIEIPAFEQEPAITH